MSSTNRDANAGVSRADARGRRSVCHLACSRVRCRHGKSARLRDQARAAAPRHERRRTSETTGARSSRRGHDLQVGGREASPRRPVHTGPDARTRGDDHPVAATPARSAGPAATCLSDRRLPGRGLGASSRGRRATRSSAPRSRSSVTASATASRTRAFSRSIAAMTAASLVPETIGRGAPRGLVYLPAPVAATSVTRAARRVLESPPPAAVPVPLTPDDPA